MGATSQQPSSFLSGVIEGFYGRPWSPAERLELFDWMAGWGLNTYVYAPKDDLKHRALWRERYSDNEASALSALIGACRERNLRFIYALSPGLDIRFEAEDDLHRLRGRLEQLLGLGCDNFALFFDDIPVALGDAGNGGGASIALAQCQLVNSVFQWVRQGGSDARFLFCPTVYCGRMLENQPGGSEYLATVGQELAPEIDVFWTGPEIISRDITPHHATAIRAILKRKPLIWDNLHANDYDGTRFFCGPYSGRPPELRESVNGLLLNPNCEFVLNYVPIRTLAQFVQCDGRWEPRDAFLSALREWLPQFDTIHGPLDFDELLLLCDCYYLPHQEGAEAETLFRLGRQLVSKDPAGGGDAASVFHQRAGQLRRLCAKLTELRDRLLFYALFRRLWDLREELDLLDGYIQHQSAIRDPNTSFRSDFHLPGTFRGGLVARLRSLLNQRADGTFVEGPTADNRPDSPPSGSPTPGSNCHIRLALPGDEPGAYHVCLKTGDFGKDGEPYYREDPDALGRVFVGPYLTYEPELSFILEDEEGICGYALGAFDSRAFYARYEAEWRPNLCRQFPAPTGDPAQWNRLQEMYDGYHHPDYFCPEPYDQFPSHLHIDLLPRAQGRGYGRRMLEAVMKRLVERGSPGAHLGVSTRNVAAIGFYQRLGFQELARAGSGNASCIYMGKIFRPISKR